MTKGRATTATATAAAATAATTTTATTATTTATKMATLFDEAQQSAACHRKNAHAIKRLKDRAPDESFKQEFLHMINKILGVKKREPAVERVVAFVAACTQLLGETTTMITDSTENTTNEETGFVEFLLSYLLQGIETKDKGMRFRVTQLIAIVMAHMDEVGNDTWEAINAKLLERSYDREANIRVQVVYALAKLQGTSEDDEDMIVARLLEMLSFDPSADVRRAVLANIVLSPQTLPAIVERARDTDVQVRKMVFRKALAEVDFTLLSIEDRESVLHAGLQDRDKTVQQACLHLMCSNWIKACNDNMIEFLSRLDVVQNPQLTEQVLTAFFDAYKAFEFPTDEAIWLNLTTESSVFLRVYCEYCSAKNMVNKLDETLPEITKLCGYLKHTYDILFSSLETDNDDVMIGTEFVLLQLLKIAKVSDFADEVGRRTMLRLVREFLLLPFTSDDILPSLMDVVQKIAITERDFIRLVSEVIADRRDPTENAQRHQRQQQLQCEIDGLRDRLQKLQAERERQRRQSEGEVDAELLAEIRQVQDSLHERSTFVNSVGDVSMLDTTVLPRNDESVDVRLACLQLAQAMLERINQPLRENPALVTMVGSMILPSLLVQDAAVQLTATACLGLCALLDVDLAKQQLGFFINCTRQKASLELCIKALKILFDLATTHGIQALDESMQTLVPVLRTLLDAEQEDVITLAAEGFSKLFLLRMTTDLNTLQRLVVLLMDPAKASNTAVRQCLSYSLQAFACSSEANQQMLSKIYVPVLQEMSDLLDTAEAANGVTVPIIAQVMLDWFDPTKILQKSPSPSSKPPIMHVAEELLVHMIEQGDGGNLLIKTVCQVISKLTIPDKCHHSAYKRLAALARLARENINDKTSLNAITKFEAQIMKADSESHVPLSEDEIVQLQACVPHVSTQALQNSLKMDYKVMTEDIKLARPTRRTANSRTKSSHNDDSEALQQNNRPARSRTARVSKKKASEDPSSSDDDETDVVDDEPDDTKENRLAATPRQHRRRQVTIADDDRADETDDDEEDDDAESAEEDED